MESCTQSRHMGRSEGAAVVRICGVQFRNLDGSLSRFFLPDFLEDVRESLPKLYLLQGNLPVYIFVNARRAPSGVKGGYLPQTKRLRVDNRHAGDKGGFR